MCCAMSLIYLTSRLIPRQCTVALCLLRALGSYPGVNVLGTSNPYTASLFADRFCGSDSSIIFYVEPGSIVSRSFTSKDTHSPRGDLLVVYGGARSTRRDAKLGRQTATLLGFKAPSFTLGTDLFLPIGANADLRKALSPKFSLSNDSDEAALSAVEALELTDFSAIPQVCVRAFGTQKRKVANISFGQTRVFFVLTW